jgi:hypothetical protein
VWVPSQRLCVSIARRNDEAGRREVGSVVDVLLPLRLAVRPTVRLCSECALRNRFAFHQTPKGSRRCKTGTVSCRVGSRWRVCERATERCKVADANERPGRINERNLTSKTARTRTRKGTRQGFYYRLCRSLALAFHAQTRSSSPASCRGVTCCASKLPSGASSPRPDAALPW